MSRFRWMAALGCAAVISAGSLATSAAAQASHRHDPSVLARVDGRTYVLLGPSVFGVTVQQDPLDYRATKFAGGTVRGSWHYDYWEAGQETTFGGTVTCLSVSGNRAWVGGQVTESSDPAQVGAGAWWQIADNGTGPHPVTPTGRPSSGSAPWSRPSRTAPVSRIRISSSMSSSAVSASRVPDALADRFTSVDDGREPAARRDRRVAVGHERGDQRFAVNEIQLQDLQPGRGQPTCAVGFIGREGRLPVAPASLERHAVLPGGREDRVGDELCYGVAAVEPGAQRRHREPDVVGDQLNEGLDVG